jgi:hypothetical protein
VNIFARPVTSPRTSPTMSPMRPLTGASSALSKPATARPSPSPMCLSSLDGWAPIISIDRGGHRTIADIMLRVVDRQFGTKAFPPGAPRANSGNEGITDKGPLYKALIGSKAPVSRPVTGAT